MAWYVDTMSGRKTSRKDYDRLKRDVVSSKVKQVVVFSLDRLGRDMIEGMELVASWCRAGCGIASITQPVDISGGPIGLAIAVLLFAFAEIGWAQRRDAQKAGIEVAKASGVYTGRKAGAISKRAAEKGGKARAAELHAKGFKPAEIATAMGVAPRTVFRYLSETKRVG